MAFKEYTNNYFGRIKFYVFPVIFNFPHSLP